GRRPSWTQSRAVGIGGHQCDLGRVVECEAAFTAGITCVVVCPISDRVGDDLPMDFNLWCSPFGSFRCLLKVVKLPSILYGLYEMKRHADKASESLRRFFCALVPLLESQLPSPDAEVTLTMGAH